MVDGGINGGEKRGVGERERPFMEEGAINEERREVGGREKKRNNGGARVERGEGKGGGERAKWGRGRGRGWKRWHQPQLAVALLSKKHSCYGT